ncbi:polyprenal reductase 1 isoform X2 [Aegilops tauschii subsp. strangulata]|uniref:polyprenal reductase 1 isoform X2 n=1 Tax=Aegilops tauschii subsp. strangulata TaxID=200361 RepID=UPI001ABC1FC2|nr:polyprenol reductase 1 isoform X2 [Aegilops tauschii subsp. strangulata]
MEKGDGPALQLLLCLAWLAATLPILAAALPIPAAAGGRLLHSLLSAFSSRGKTVRPSSSSSSSSSKAKFTVPQKYFLHFYVVGVAVTTSLLLAICFYAYMKMTPLLPEPSSYSTIASHLIGSNSFSFGSVLSRTMEHKYRVWRTVFVLLLMEIQVLRRLYETENVFHYSPSARMHIVGYLTGLFYYTAAPLSLASSCLPEAIDFIRGQIVEFIVKGRARMPDLVIDSPSLLKPLLKLGWCQWIGAIVFIWGSLHQIRCHAILGSLRENKDSDEYVIPCGDWFSRVSCPHYLAELITNLSFAAVQTHRWYLQKFEDYPRSRYAIIPFVL